MLKSPRSVKVPEIHVSNTPRFYQDKLACAVTAAVLTLAAPYAWANGGAGGDGVLNSTAGGAAGTADTSGGGTSVDGYIGGVGGNAGSFGGDGDGSGSSGGDNSSSPGGGSSASQVSGGGGAGGNGGTWGAGGGGGGGSSTQKTSNPTFTLNSGTVAGGDGGRGGNGVVSGGITYSTGGGGGGGGSAVILSGSSNTTVTIGGSLRGGNGGNAGAGILNGFGAEGGDGGYGLVISGTANVTVSAGGEIRGGAGGNGAVDASGVVVGRGGRGQIGLLLNGSSNTVVNAGTIAGGDGGDGGRDPGNTRYSAGVPQVAILGTNTSIINSGTIQGGLSGDGVTRALAIQLSGTGNRLELRNGSTILGNVQVSGGTLALGGTDDMTFDASSIGSSAQYAGFTSYEKTGTSTATLANTTTAVTPWTLTGGTLSIASDGALGDSAGALTFNGGTLQITGTGFDSTRAVHATGSDAIVEFTDNLGKVTLGGVIDGNGGLSVIGTGLGGSGTLTLVGTNTYTGATTVDNGAALIIGDGGTHGSIASSSLVINTGGVGFARSDDITYGGTISGTGNFGQIGTGKLTLTADSSGFNGITLVSSGTLQVDNKLGGRTAVFGGTLAGTGELGLTQIATGGTLAPGSATAPTGTLTFDNGLLMTTGSTLRVTALPDGTNSKVMVNGAAQLAGSVMHMGTEGTYAASTTYNILEATGGVSGKFDSVSSNFAYLDPSLTYDTNKVNLVVNMKQVSTDPGNGGGDSSGGGSGNGGTRPIRFADLADTSNQRSVANALQSLPTDSALYSRVLNLPNGAPAGVFESLNGEAHASVSNTLNGVANNVVSLPMAHLRANMDAGQRAGQPTAQLGRGDASSLPQSTAQPVWAQVFGNWRTLGGGNGTNEVSQTDGGVFAGGDHLVGGGWRLGGALGYTGSHSSIKGLSSHADVDSYSGIIYGGKAFEAGRGKINLSLGAAYTWHDIDTDRGVNAAGVAQDLTSSYSASTTQLFTELGYALPLTSRITLEPYVAADYSDQRTRGFSESGGDAALMGQSSHDQVGSSTLGLRAQTTFESGNSEGRLFASAGWRHSYGDLNPSTTMAFDGSQSFNVVGAPIARDAAVMSLGVDMAVTRNTTVGLTYAGQFGGGNRQNSGSLDVRWRF